MYNLKLDGFWYHLRGNKKTSEIFNFSLKSNRNAPLNSAEHNAYYVILEFYWITTLY